MRVEFKVLLILLLTILFIPGCAVALPGMRENMTEIGSFFTNEPRSAEFYNDYLFIADTNALLVFNASNPEKPHLVNTYKNFSDPGRVYGLSISGDRLYIASGPGWIYVLNISNPEKPEKLYQLNYFSNANDVSISGKYMYVADTNTGMLIFDLTQRRQPELSGIFYVLRSNVSGSLQGWGGVSVAVSGRYAFLNGAQRKGFYIIDVSDPTNPTEVFHSIDKEIYDIAMSENNVYIARANGTTQFDVLDISNPYNPKIAGSFFIFESAERSAIAIHPSGSYLYAASANKWHIFKIKDTIPPEIIIVKPEDGEIFANKTIIVSGHASDKSGISEVLVNGKFAGTLDWNQIIELDNDTNNINITAHDKNGNSVSKIIKVDYRPAMTTQTKASEIPPDDVKTSMEQKEDILKKNIFYGFLALIVIIVGIWAYRKKG